MRTATKDGVMQTEHHLQQWVAAERRSTASMTAGHRGVAARTGGVTLRRHFAAREASGVTVLEKDIAVV